MEWISVKDRLPEDRKSVLAYADNGATFVASHDDDWYVDTGEYYYSSPLANITHWMPLPPAPKGGRTNYSIECLEIKRVCDKYGYGNVMEWASALWRLQAKKEGYPTGGCFVPTCPDFIKDEFKCPEQHELYDRLVEAVLMPKEDA